MQFLNLIYFLILILAAYRFLMSDGRIVKSPFNKCDHLLLTGPEMYWVLVFSTGFLAFQFDMGIDLMAIRLFIIMVLCLIGFRFTSEKPIWSWPLVIYGIYLAWLALGCIYSPSFGYGIRVVLKYLFPLIFCLFASAVTDNFATALKAALSARWVALITVLVCAIPYYYVLLPDVIWYVTARSIGYISIMVFSLGLVFFSKEKKENILYTIFFLLPCFVYVLRTSILGSVVAVIAVALIRWRMKSLPVILGLLLCGVGCVFWIPSLRQKMFYDDNVTIENFQQGQISMDNVNTNTRAALWKKVEKNLYKNHEIVGSGTGAVQMTMYSNPKAYFGLIVPHSDFVQIKCDNGIIGLCLYCVMVFSVYIHCFIIYWRTQDNRLKLFAMTAGASLLGIFATFYSDNTVNYSMTTLSFPFGFYGMTLALKRSLRKGA